MVIGVKRRHFYHTLQSCHNHWLSFQFAASLLKIKLINLGTGLNYSEHNCSEREHTASVNLDREEIAIGAML